MNDKSNNVAGLDRTRHVKKHQNKNGGINIEDNFRINHKHNLTNGVPHSHDRELYDEKLKELINLPIFIQDDLDDLQIGKTTNAYYDEKGNIHITMVLDLQGNEEHEIKMMIKWEEKANLQKN